MKDKTNTFRRNKEQNLLFSAVCLFLFKGWISYDYMDALLALRAWNSANLASNSGLKCLMSPWTGHAAPSAKAQMVWPSICLVSSQSRSISSGLALPSTEIEMKKWSSKSGIISEKKITKSPHHGVHPVASFTARCALATGLMLVKESQPSNGLDDVSLFVHDDDSGRSQTGLSGNQCIKIHQDVIANPENSRYNFSHIKIDIK